MRAHLASRSVSGAILATTALFGLLVACLPGQADGDAGATLDSTPGLPGEPLSSEESSDLAAVLPEASRKKIVAIPTSLLDGEDIDAENTAVLEVLDDQGERVGILRDIFTLVHCVSGVCRAIRFVLVYDAQRQFVDLYHPSGDSHPLMKYWNNAHTEFDAQDMGILRAMLNDPPASLLGLADIDDLVVGATETAPTRVEYQDLVVRGAAFTTYEIMMYHVETRSILAQVLP